MFRARAEIAGPGTALACCGRRWRSGVARGLSGSSGRAAPVAAARRSVVLLWRSGLAGEPYDAGGDAGRCWRSRGRGLAGQDPQRPVAAPIAPASARRRRRGFVVDVVSPGAAARAGADRAGAHSGPGARARRPTGSAWPSVREETPAPGQAGAAAGHPQSAAAAGRAGILRLRPRRLVRFGWAGSPSPWARSRTRHCWIRRPGGCGCHGGQRFRWLWPSGSSPTWGPVSGGIGAAMVTGHEAWITPEDQTDAMRASGLAHILSISGLHMAIVGGFVFGSVPTGVAAWPWLALRAPGKKIAAVAGLIAVGTYLVISARRRRPSGPRSPLSVAFLAILFDRQADHPARPGRGGPADPGPPARGPARRASRCRSPPPPPWWPWSRLAAEGARDLDALADPLAGRQRDRRLVAGGHAASARSLGRRPGDRAVRHAALQPIWPSGPGLPAANLAQALAVRPGVREFAADLWSRRRGLTLTDRPEAGWVCGRYACAPEVRDAAPVALWWGTKAPTPEVLSALCASAPVVSVRAAVAELPAGCADTLVLDGVDYARGGAVELWRGGPDGGAGWKAVWTSDVRGDRPWSKTPKS
jgi:hypothetical protein